MKPRRITAEVFWSRTTEDGECLLWTGWLDRDGYGRISWEGEKVLAHRLAFFLRMGRWPDGILRHLCNRPACVLHAVEGTQSQNMYDKRGAGTDHNAIKTHCVRGHEYNDQNTYTYIDNGWVHRHCRLCQRIWNATRKAKRNGSPIPADRDEAA